MQTIALPGGETVAALGQGTWYMGERQGNAAKEAAALRLGIDLGMTLIDTAEMYASGGAEQVVAQAVSGIRDKVFIVSKVLPQNASRSGVPAACERSLQRLKTDRIDLYLLHWRGGHPVAETVAAFEALKTQGKIRYWGVSNFDTADMTELQRVPNGANCAANQVLYHPDSRGIEFDLLPWCAKQGVPVMAQVAIAWGMRDGNVISIPKAADTAHVRENAAAADIRLTDEDLAAIDAAHPPPRRKTALDLL
jgi:diketogulonate reductase-like aldo/keto reductase